MKKIKNILFTLIFSLVIGCQAVVSHAASLSDLKAGVYTIKNDVSHESDTGMAMARSYLNETMTLEKSNGSWYYTIKFSGLQYMSKHAIYINGSKVSHTVKSKNTSADTIELKFKTKSITPNLKVSMYVSAMGRDVEFGVIPKESTLKLVKATEESKSESSTSSSSNNTNSSTSQSSSSNKNNSSTSQSSSSNKTNSSTSQTSSSNKTSSSSSSSSSSSTKTETKTETKSEEVEKESDKAKEETVEAEESKEEVAEETAEEKKEESDKAEEEAVEAEEVVETTEVVSEASEEKSSNKLIFIGTGAIVVIAIIAVVLRRVKK